MPTQHRCKAKSKRTKLQCRLWAMKKTNGGYYRTCYFHGAPGALGVKAERKVINKRKTGPRQWKRYEKRWAERTAAYDAWLRVAEARGASTSMEAEFRGMPRPKKLPPLY